VSSSRPLVAVLAILASLPAVVQAASPTVEYALGLRPSQRNVDYDSPQGEAARNSTIKTEKSAFVVRGPAGEVLRVFADTNGDTVLDTVIQLTGTSLGLTFGDFVA